MQTRHTHCARNNKVLLGTKNLNINKTMFNYIDLMTLDIRH